MLPVYYAASQLLYPALDVLSHDSLVIFLFATAWPPFAAAVSWTPASEEGGGKTTINFVELGLSYPLWRRNAASSLNIISRRALSPTLLDPCLWTSLHCNYSLGCRLMIILCLVPSVCILCRFISCLVWNSTRGCDVQFDLFLARRHWILMLTFALTCSFSRRITPEILTGLHFIRFFQSDLVEAAGFLPCYTIIKGRCRSFSTVLHSVIFCILWLFACNQHLTRVCGTCFGGLLSFQHNPTIFMVSKECSDCFVEASRCFPWAKCRG